MTPVWNADHDHLARRLIELARDEDLGPTGIDLTGSLFIAPDARGRAAVVARQAGVAAGIPLVQTILDVFSASDVAATCILPDGGCFASGDTLLTLEGAQRSIVRAERTMLNLLARMCGVATLTAAYVEAVGDGAKIYDTRKTTPGLRVFEKYAVRCGGGHNHRMGLSSAVLIKDNHLAASLGATESLTPALEQAACVARRSEQHGPEWFFEVEVDTLDQFEQTLKVEAGLIDVVMLDNFRVEDLAAAVAQRDACRPGLILEASGGVRLENASIIAKTGVDRISVGALTHSAVSLDLGLDAL